MVVSPPGQMQPITSFLQRPTEAPDSAHFMDVHAMMGPDGVTDASRVAIVHANYIASRLKGHYDVLYRKKGRRP